MSERWVEFEIDELPDHPNMDIIVGAKVTYLPHEGYTVEDIEAFDQDNDQQPITLTSRELIILENKAIEQAQADDEAAFDSRD